MARRARAAERPMSSPIHGRGAAVEALVLRVTDKPQVAHWSGPRCRQRATQVRRVAGRNDRLAVRERECRDTAPGGLVNPGHHFLDIAGAELRLIRQLLRGSSYQNSTSMRRFNAVPARFRWSNRV
jgi:hypothetical protein